MCRMLYTLISPTDAELTPPSGANFMFIGCRSHTDSVFNVGIFGSSKILTNLQDFDNAPTMVSEAAEHNGYFYYNTNSLTPFFRTDPLLYHKFWNLVMFRPGNLYSVYIPGNQDYQKIISISTLFVAKKINNFLIILVSWATK